MVASQEPPRTTATISATRTAHKMKAARVNGMFVILAAILLCVACTAPLRTVVDARYLPTRADDSDVATLKDLIIELMAQSSAEQLAHRLARMQPAVGGYGAPHSGSLAQQYQQQQYQQAQQQIHSNSVAHQLEKRAAEQIDVATNDMIRGVRNVRGDTTNT